MFKKKLLWYLFPSYLLIIMLSLLLITWHTTHVFKNFYFKKVETNQETIIKLYENNFINALNENDTKKLDNLAKEIAKNASLRITIISSNGKVLSDSQEKPSLMENHHNRPEILKALSGKISNEIRYSKTLKTDMMYVALPIIKSAQVVGIIRTSVAITLLQNNLNILYKKIFLGGLITTLFAMLISYLFSRKIQKPLLLIEESALKFADGNFTSKIPIHPIKEIGGLANAMNIMSVQLNDRINTIVQQKNEQEAVFNNMAEGIIAFDQDKKIIKINKIATVLLNITAEKVKKQKIETVITNQDFVNFVDEIFRTQSTLEKEIIIKSAGEKFLRTKGTVITNKDSGIVAIIVINDITKVKQLENVRKDFVANVSHELKTPVTAIKGFIETLQDGAIDNPQEAKHFLDIILKHTNRLNAIIEDLLSLSRLEQNNNSSTTRMEQYQLYSVLESAIQICKINSSIKSMKVSLQCSHDIYVNLDILLFEQSIVNLIDNAIKYSDENKEISITVNKTEKEILIELKDQGCGISEEDIPRIFERFYRVDKARSKNVGGTGLGLAIVKHIINSHNGYITVCSSLHCGSAFTIHLPNESQ